MCNLIGFVNNGELFNTFFFINGFQMLILVSISKVMGKLNISLGLCTGMLYRVFKTFFFISKFLPLKIKSNLRCMFTKQ